MHVLFVVPHQRILMMRLVFHSSITRQNDSRITHSFKVDRPLADFKINMDSDLQGFYIGAIG